MYVWAIVGSSQDPGVLGDHLGRFTGGRLPEPTGYRTGTTCDFAPNPREPNAVIRLMVVQVVS